MKNHIKKMKTLFRKGAFALTAMLSLAMLPSSAHAAEAFGAAKIMKNLMLQFQVGGETIIAVSFVLGLVFVAISGLLIKDAGDFKQAQQNKGIFGAILGLWFGAAIMFYIGLAGTLFGESLFGEDAKKASSLNETEYGL